MVAASRESLNWVLQWKQAAAEIERVHDEELHSLSDESALQTIEAVLSMVDVTKLPEWRRHTSGFVKLQQTLHVRRER